MYNPKISIIVPVYNSENYLADCINSILIQSFTDFEIILVNDGSSDNSGNICNELKKKDDRIKVIHKNNEGVSKARATGIKHSLGHYIMFVDSDDLLPINSLELLFNEIGNHDIVVGIVQRNDFTTYLNYKEIIINKIQWINGILDGSFHSGPVAKLIKRECIKIEDFNIPRNVVYGEDLVQNINTAFHCHSIKIIKKVVYIYRMNDASVSNKFVYTIKYGELLYNIVTEILKQNSFKLESSYQIFCLNILKHIASSNELKKNNSFIKELINSIKYKVWFKKKNILWLFIFKFKFIYLLYLIVCKKNKYL